MLPLIGTTSRYGYVKFLMIHGLKVLRNFQNLGVR